MNTMCLGGIIYIHIEKSRLQERTVWQRCLHYSWRWHFAFHRNSEFSYLRMNYYSSLYIPGTDLIEMSLPECSIVSGETTCPQICFLVTDVYTDVTW
jgi:hypothetical protein